MTQTEGAGDTLTRLAGIVHAVGGTDPEEVQADREFSTDLGLDSLSMIEVVVGAEEEFGVVIPDRHVKDLRTVGDAVAFIDKHRG